MRTELRDFLSYNINHTIIYSPDQIHELLKDLKDNIKLVTYKKRKGAKVYNLPCSFDIETSSFYEGKEKRACMYMWQMSICGLIVIGRRWTEFVDVLQALHDDLNLSDDLHLIIYVQSLAYEFQFCRCWLEWAEVFAIDNRKPVHATTTNGIEFKCSYVLSAFSLAKMGEHLTEIPVIKTQGLEYYVVRHSESLLTWDEIRYAVNDVQVVVSFIYEEMLRNGNITKIPLTNTGYVRAFCRRACLQGYDNDPKKRKYKRIRYMSFMSNLTLTPDEYLQARRAFAGGYTHANPFYVNMNVWCFVSKDYTSKYPAKAVLESEFPMSKAEVIDVVTPEIFKESIELYFCMFDVVFEDLEPTFLYDNYIQSARCWERENITVSNGRIVRGSVVGTTITNIDFDIIKRTYKWKKIKVARFRRYKKGYLPTDLVRSILSLYSDKTTLKDVIEMIVEYMHKKGMLNATYGMMCQAIYKELNEYDTELDEWNVKQANGEEEIEKYNNSKNRFSFYLWALVITATARRDLWSAIIACGEDYLYSDTDSIKYLNPEKHQEYFDAYNRYVIRQIEKSAEFHRIPKELFMPKTLKGEVKPIGAWDDDGSYMEGRFLGAKRYLLMGWDGHITLTISGVNKKSGLKYLEKTYGTNIFENFTNKLYFPKGTTGKLIHTYIDYETQGAVTDYLGVKGYYHELSSVHLEEGDYSLSMAQEFVDYLNEVQDVDDPDY